MSGEAIQDPCGHLGGHPAGSVPVLVSYRCWNTYREPRGLKEHTSLSYRSLPWVAMGKTRVLAGLCSFWRLSGRISFLAFSGFQRLPSFSQLLPPSKPAVAVWSFSPSLALN